MKAETTKATTNKEIKAIATALSNLEGLGNLRRAVMAVVENDLRAIDAKRKEARESLTELLKQLRGHDTAVAVCNALCPTVAGANDTTRKRISRRRQTLCRCLATAYSDYDFTVERGRNGGKIIATYEGDEARRKAKRFLTLYAEMKEYGFNTKDSIETLAEKIRTGKQSSTPEMGADPVPVSRITTIASQIGLDYNKLVSAATAETRSAANE